jgi:phage repressor protein C with HTH and peptisase S24 domain
MGACSSSAPEPVPEETPDQATGAPEAEEEAPAAGPSEEDIATCSGITVDKAAGITELVRLLNVFKNVPSPDLGTMKEQRYCGKVVDAIRSCSSVVAARQDAAIAEGVAAPMVEVLTGVHLEDRETCMRVARCIDGICMKNEAASTAFSATGGKAALEAVIAKHSDRDTKTFEKALASMSEPAATAAAAATEAAPEPAPEETPEPAAGAPEPAAEEEAPAAGPSEEDIATCSGITVDKAAGITELVRLLNVFKNVPSPDLGTMKEQRYCGKVVDAIRSCSSVVAARQDAAIAEGVAAPMVEVLTGVHLEDRETCMRVARCIDGICMKNEAASTAFSAAGGKAALEAVIAKHSDRDTKTFEKALAYFA